MNSLVDAIMNAHLQKNFPAIEHFAAIFEDKATTYPLLISLMYDAIAEGYLQNPIVVGGSEAIKVVQLKIKAIKLEETAQKHFSLSYIYAECMGDHAKALFHAKKAVKLEPASDVYRAHYEKLIR